MYQKFSSENSLLKTDVEITVYCIEPRREKTCLRGFRAGPTQTGLYIHRGWLGLEISD